MLKAIALAERGGNMTKVDDLLEEQLKDDEFRKEYEALEPEFSIMQAMIDARISKGLTRSSTKNT